MADMEYEKLRQSYKPSQVDWLFIAESPPPPEGTISTRHFYRLNITSGDRLFANTIRAIYDQAAGLNETQLAESKANWLRRFQNHGCYMIECLDHSLPHGTTTANRRKAIIDNLPTLIDKVSHLANPSTKIILIKSNPFNITNKPLKQAGFNVINTTLVDYPGFWREEAYRSKLRALLLSNGWNHQSDRA